VLLILAAYFGLPRAYFAVRLRLDPEYIPNAVRQELMDNLFCTEAEIIPQDMLDALFALENPTEKSPEYQRVLARFTDMVADRHGPDWFVTEYFGFHFGSDNVDLWVSSNDYSDGLRGVHYYFTSEKSFSKTVVAVWQSESYSLQNFNNEFYVINRQYTQRHPMP
jgi:hypothetical protein